MGRNRLLIIVSVANAAVLLVNIFASLYFVTNNSFSRLSSEQFPYLSKRIFAEDPNNLILNFVTLRQQLTTDLEPYGSRASVYFEYLPSGVSIGINDRKQVRLASLAKIPTVMAAHRVIATQEFNKDTKVLLKEEYRDQQFGSLWKFEAGATSTVGELMRLAITESDNTAHNALLDILPTSEINSIYDSLDIPFDSRDGYPLISAKNYSSILRSLFLSSYLPKEDSQEILEIMTETIYKDKIPALLPEYVKVAHKIGVYETKEPKTSTFSDCGIVYPPKRPYLLCVMFEGNDSDAQTMMSKTSKTIYDYVISAK